MKNRLQRAAALVLCAAVLCMSTACAVRKKQALTATAAETTLSTTTAAQTTTEAPEGDGDALLIYDYLSEEEQAIYRRITDAISSNQAYMDENLLEFKAGIIDRVYFFRVMADHPEYFDVRANSNLYENTGTGEQTARLDIQLLYDGETYQARTARMQEALEQVKQALPAQADGFQKARAAYDYLINTCEYDYSYSGSSLDEAGTTASYADGALVDHKAVCSGYSRAFKWLMDALDVPCMCISNSDHEWNMVRIQGNCYHVDVTWADTEGGADRYFCLTDEEIYRNRERPQPEVPECVIVANFEQ